MQSAFKEYSPTLGCLLVLLLKAQRENWSVLLMKAMSDLLSSYNITWECSTKLSAYLWSTPRLT